MVIAVNTQTRNKNPKTNIKSQLRDFSKLLTVPWQLNPHIISEESDK